MATVGQLYHNILNYEQPGQRQVGLTPAQLWGSNWATDAETQNLIDGSLIPGTHVDRLGIQAPPGTKIVISTLANESSSSLRTILIGRTGVYELEETIYYLGIVPQQKWAKDTTNTTKAAAVSLKGFTKCNDFMTKTEDNTLKFSDALPSISASEFPSGFNYVDDNPNNTYGPYVVDGAIDEIEYIKTNTKYNAQYSQFLSLYYQGINGIYNEDGYEDINDIIIDYFINTVEG